MRTCHVRNFLEPAPLPRMGILCGNAWPDSEYPPAPMRHQRASSSRPAAVAGPCPSAASLAACLELGQGAAGASCPPV